MEASTRLLVSSPSSFTRHLLSKPRLLSLRFPNPNPRPLLPPKLPSCRRHGHGHGHGITSSLNSFSPRNPRVPRNPFLSLSHTLSSHSSPPIDGHDLGLSNGNGASPLSDRVTEAPTGGDLGFPREKAATWTVVLLGWLGAEEKHLKRYAEMYSSKGFRAVRLVVPMRETVGLDLGKNVEARIKGLAMELATWCAEGEKVGEERYLVFHTFSNTGWLM